MGGGLNKTLAAMTHGEPGDVTLTQAQPALPASLQTELFYALTSAVLEALALQGEPQPYSAVAPIVGYHHRDRNFYAMLGRSLREDHAAGRRLRASLVINKAHGIPGPAYFTVCRELGYDIPPGKETEFWADQLKRFDT